MKNTSKNVRMLTQLAMLIAIELVMRAVGLGAVPVGPLNMSFLTLPIAVGAIVIGPAAGAIMGGVFGLLSLSDAVSGRSVMTGTFFALSPIHTIILCVGMRVLMGYCCALVFRALHKLDAKETWSYFVGAISAPLLNTLFFMGYICLVFYRTEFIQKLVVKYGAANPVMFVILLVGVQGLVEAVTCGFLGGILSKAVFSFTRKLEQKI